MSELSIIPVKPGKYKISPVTRHRKKAHDPAPDFEGQLKANPDNAFAFMNHAKSLKNKELGMPYIFKALELAPNLGELYYIVGRAMQRQETLLLPGGHCMTRTQCFLKAIELDPNCAYAYSALPVCMYPNKYIMVNGKKMSDEECLITAFDLEPDSQTVIQNALIYFSKDRAPLKLSSGFIVTKEYCLARIKEGAEEPPQVEEPSAKKLKESEDE